ncbi:MAG: sugar ABC transporter permease [Lachnospiraceae bacterium]|jgi:multiple sugar transport system permease protein/putative aldouronate transport system permease protein|nr:sugar ABC transporter permease [Lachnospiraceae bacterium]SDA75820.1 multiple sugar transport system permease protein [Lachnospiraceae bacterium G11]
MKGFLHNTWKNRNHVLMALPVFLVLFFIMYVPMGGLILAFKKFDYQAGIFGSPWVGLENFKMLIASKSKFYSITRNTVLYYLLFTAVGTLLNVTLAIALDRLFFKKLAKTMQTIMIVPVFISYAAVNFINFAFISTDTGIINNTFGTSTRFYSTAALWPWILLIIKIWKDTGYGSVLYMSVLAGVDSELYEAAEIDGANKWQSIWHISIPSLIPMITVMLLLSVGNIMRSDTGLFYQVTRNSGMLYDTTQVIDSYILNAIMKSANFGFTAASSLFQSVIGLIMMLVANFTVRKIAPENALF